MSEPGHGHSTAAWTGVTLLLVASLVLSVGVFFGLAWAIWGGIALAVLGVGAWLAMNAAGLGEDWDTQKHAKH